MEIPGERVSAAGYLVKTGEEVQELSSQTSWLRSEERDKDYVTDVLLVFRRPEESPRENAPSEHPDWMQFAVSLDRYRDHISDYLKLGWIHEWETEGPWNSGGGRPSPWDCGFRYVSWRSWRLDRVIEADLERMTQSSTSYGAAAPYLGPSRPLSSSQAMGSSIGAGMRAGVAAAFLDGITDGGFFDF